MNKQIRKAEILKYLGAGEKTARELAYDLGFRERNATAPRLTEMVKEGTVIVTRKVPDFVTGKKVSVYKAVIKED